MPSRSSRGYWGYGPVDGAVGPDERRPSGRAPGSLAAVLILMIAAYRRLVSPLLGPTCRFHPTCSSYAIEAIHRYGMFGGSARAAARLARIS